MWQYANPFTMDIVVSADDTDRLGHTNNQVYIKWMEEISWRHIEQHGLTWDKQTQENRAMAIHRTDIEYLQASYEGDALVMATWITSCERQLTTSRHFQCVRPADGKTIIQANSHYVSIDLKTGKPARMPKWYQQTLQQLAIETQ
ncbi:acyl-CoA thioesterase [Bermanella sp. R86510]|uniref:acyl-CoA thioesterase n=1 Tax=unclassified Bermanella TaxID=2627862 RepID=UPI0037CC3D35